MAKAPTSGPLASSAQPYTASILPADTSATSSQHPNPDAATLSLASLPDKKILVFSDAEDDVHSGQADNSDGDTSFNDDDSAFGGSLIGCDTDTLSSFVTDYRYENGRRYHAYKDGSYWGPNDEHANEIHDLAHHMYLMTLEGKLHLAPIENPHNVLDLGTGTGIWAIDMADAYPSAKVIGTDLSPIQPFFIPPNCQFEIEDFNPSWTYPKNHFDFIHMRELFGCVSDWDDFFGQVYDHTKPGGYVEILEHSVWPVSDDDTVNENSFFTKWGKTVVECGEKFGKSFNIWKESKEVMERAGFVDVVETRYKWPMNGWPCPEHRTHGNDGDKSWERLRDIGVWNQLRLYDGVESFMLRLLTTALGMRNEIRDLKIHAYLDVSVVHGRKPGGRPKTAPKTAPKSSPPSDHSEYYSLGGNLDPEGAQNAHNVP